MIIEEIVDGSEPTDQPTCLPAEVLAKDTRRWTNYQAAVAERVAKDDRADTKPTDDQEDLQEDSARA